MWLWLLVIGNRQISHFITLTLNFTTCTLAQAKHIHIELTNIHMIKKQKDCNFRESIRILVLTHMIRIINNCFLFFFSGETENGG